MLIMIYQTEDERYLSTQEAYRETEEYAKLTEKLTDTEITSLKTYLYNHMDDRSDNGIYDMVDAEYNRLFDNGGDMLKAEIPFTWKESGGNKTYTVAATYPMDTDGVMRFTGSVYDNGRNHDIFMAGAESRRLALEVIRQYRLGNMWQHVPSGQHNI